MEAAAARRRRVRSADVSIALLLLLGLAVPAHSQIPSEFTNLEILPKDIERGELVSIMRDFAGALGVRCIHCHVGEDPDSLKGVDFASDELPAKQTAREMMRMVQEINGTLLPKIGKKSPRQVRCVTCHHGLEHPETVQDVLAEALEQGGPKKVIARYRELREEYYGRGIYDFSYRALSRLIEGQARGGDMEGALALVDLNLEFHPTVANVHIMRGQILMQQNNEGAARVAFERALELEPDNAFVKRLLERVKPSDSPVE